MPRYPIELQQPLEKASLVLISPYSCSFRFLLFCLLAPFPGPSLCFFGGLKRRGASGDPLEPPARACGPLIPPSFFRLFLGMDVVPDFGSVLLASPSPSACAPRAQRDTTGRWQRRALRSRGPEVPGGCLTQRPRLALVRPHRGRSATRKQRDLPKTWLGFPLCSLVLPATGWATRGLPAPRSSQQPPRRFRGAGRALFTRRQTTNLPRWTR